MILTFVDVIWLFLAIYLHQAGIGEASKRDLLK